jgi:hypothetical protein
MIEITLLIEEKIIKKLKEELIIKVIKKLPRTLADELIYHLVRNIKEDDDKIKIEMKTGGE